jgi:hypothetical protein
MFRKALKTIKDNFREYVLLNLLYYSLVASSMAYTYTFPEVQRGLMEALGEEFKEGFPWVAEAYTSGNFPMAAILTFSVNLALGSFVCITLPSLIMPFGGVIIGCIRATLWGLLLAPTSPELAQAMIPHSLTLVLEGQGYILAMYAVTMQWKGVIRPRSIGEEKRLKAYIVGIKKTTQIYLLITLVLVISAIYEAFEVIYIVGKHG